MTFAAMAAAELGSEEGQLPIGSGRRFAAGFLAGVLLVCLLSQSKHAQ